MKMTARDWAQYNLEDFNISAGISCELDVDQVLYEFVEMSEGGITYYTLKTRDGKYIIYVGVSGRGSIKNWIQSKIEQAKELLQHDNDFDWDDISD